MKNMAPPVFWRNMRERYNLIGNKCLSCGSITYPGRTPCAKCSSQSFAKERLSGKGKLISWTSVKTAPAGFEGPYVVGMVELEEGPVFAAQVIGEEGKMKFKAPVRQAFRKLAETEDHLLVYGTKFEIVE